VQRSFRVGPTATDLDNRFDGSGDCVAERESGRHMLRRAPARTESLWIAIDIALKVALIALLAFALAHPDWPRFANKAMLARAVVYPLLVAVVPAAWAWRRRAGGVSHKYPALVSILVTVPFVVDAAGNALDLYNRIDVFDDVCHLVNWATLCLAVGIALMGNPALPPWVIAGLCVGFGATTAVLWEIGEYGAFVTRTPERFSLYRDTMGDLALGLAGSLVAGLVCLVAARRQRRWS
jgi:hypothetical protein